MTIIYCEYNNEKYGIIIMDYLNYYETISEFRITENNIRSIFLGTNVYTEFRKRYNESLYRVLQLFASLNLFIYDFQFMIKKNGSDIKIIDFGTAQRQELDKSYFTNLFDTYKM